MPAAPASSSVPAHHLDTPLRGMSPLLVIGLLALLLGLQPITTDLYLPALPLLTAQLQAPVAQTQLTLTALLLAFGGSQLVWGPVSDRWGRRPVLLAGLALYVVAALGCALAPSMTCWNWLGLATKPCSFSTRGTRSTSTRGSRSSRPRPSRATHPLKTLPSSGSTFGEGIRIPWSTSTETRTYPQKYLSVTPIGWLSHITTAARPKALSTGRLP